MLSRLSDFVHQFLELAHLCQYLSFYIHFYVYMSLIITVKFKFLLVSLNLALAVISESVINQTIYDQEGSF